MIIEKPWGTYEILIDVPERGYKVKRIVVYPYQQFSLQYHKKRTEHWSIVSGTGTITLNGRNMMYPLVLIGLYYQRPFTEQQLVELKI